MKKIKKNIACIVWMFCFISWGMAQVSDDFSDGDITSDPTWEGTIGDFTVNTNKQAQLNASGGGTSYMATPHLLSDFDNKEWNFWVRQSFSATSGNYGRYYLSSTSSDLASNPNGIYLQLGETSSLGGAVRLMQKSDSSTDQICASANGLISSSFSIRIRVLRDDTGQWSLYINSTGGESFPSIAQAQGTETSMPTGTHIGYRCTYTSSNSTKFYLDDVYVGPEIIDEQPPVMTVVNVIDSDKINVFFSEDITTISAEDISNYTISPPVTISSAIQNTSDYSLVHIQLASPLTNGTEYTFTSIGITDISNNVAGEQTLPFQYLIGEIPAVGDVIINEFMADPSPVVELPEAEFVEIYNRSNKIFNLTGWKLGDNATFGTIQSGWLQPGEYKILCPINVISEFPVAIGVTSFPSLNNTTDDVAIADNTGQELDRLTYNLEWYQDKDKQDGGWTLERINPDAPCSDQTNWRASIHPSGGTPGVQNSVYDTTPDTSPPSLKSISVVSENEVLVEFNKAMKSTILSTATITTEPNLIEDSRTVSSQPTTFLSVLFDQNLELNKTYKMTIHLVQDCWGNVGTLSGLFARPSQPDSGDVVLNELLFDQYAGGSDWIELYNRSNKVIDLKNWKFARFNNDKLITDYKTVSSSYILYPDDYVVIGGDSSFVLQRYPSAVSGKFYQLNLPTMANESGSIIVLYPKIENNDTTDLIMDKVEYSSKWHFELLSNKDGKALERLNPDFPTQDPKNWHTAAQTIGFATPGRKNSQYFPAQYNGKVNLSSEVISPDNDGIEDVLLINYEMNAPEMLATVRIYDDRGRLIKNIAENELVSTQGRFLWDGIRSDGQKATIGVYVMLFEAFNINGGDEFIAKKAFVVAGKM